MVGLRKAAQALFMLAIFSHYWLNMTSERRKINRALALRYISILQAHSASLQACISGIPNSQEWHKFCLRYNSIQCIIE